MDFSGKITCALERMTQAELAKRLGVSAQALNHWATGKHLPRYQTAVRLEPLLDEVLAGERAKAAEVAS